MWELVIITAVSSFGHSAGTQEIMNMPDKDTCFMSMRDMEVRVNGREKLSWESRYSIVFCREKKR